MTIRTLIDKLQGMDLDTPMGIGNVAEYISNVEDVRIVEAATWNDEKDDWDKDQITKVCVLKVSSEAPWEEIP